MPNSSALELRRARHLVKNLNYRFISMIHPLFERNVRVHLIPKEKISTYLPSWVKCIET